MAGVIRMTGNFLWRRKQGFAEAAVDLLGREERRAGSGGMKKSGLIMLNCQPAA
jgi:hypothetical protein